jgi:uncharacterized protein (TIRG00374 family)
VALELVSRDRLLRAATSLPARLAVTTGLLAIVAATIDWDALSEAIANASWGWFVACLAMIWIGFVLGAVRWRLLLAAASVAARMRLALRAYVCGAFANSLLPTGFGGDAVRAWLVAHSGAPLARSLTSVLVDRATALGCGLLLAWIAVAAAPGEVPGAHAGLLAVCSGAALAGFVLIALAARRSGLGRFVPASLRPYAAEVAATLRGYLRDRRLAAEVLGLGLAFQASAVAAIWALAQMLDLEVGAAPLAVVTPLVLIATALPISIAGFGVREGSFVALLGDLGVSAGEATLLSLLSVAAMALASLPGGALLLLGRGRPVGAEAGGPSEAPGVPLP